MELIAFNAAPPRLACSGRAPSRTLPALMLAPETWLALLRAVVGAWFVRAGRGRHARGPRGWGTNLALGPGWGVLPYPMVPPRFVPFPPKGVAEFAAGNPIGWYKDFLE